MNSPKPKNIDEYISAFPAEIQEKLQKVRETIKQISPQAEEAISYAIPTFKLNKKNLVHFAGFEKHIGFYPAPVGLEAFKKDLSEYKTGKGSVQFPNNKPLPIELIKKMTKFRLAEMEEKTKGK